MGVVVDVVVVGTGVSGLSCAVALLEAGADVRLPTARGPASSMPPVARSDGWSHVRLGRRTRSCLGTAFRRLLPRVGQGFSHRRSDRCEPFAVGTEHGPG